MDRIVRRAWSAEPVNQSLIDAYRAWFRVPRLYTEVEEHATAAELLARGPDAVGRGRWTVFDPDGRWLGTVTLPGGLRVTEIGSDYVLGVWLDELEVPFVRLHRIVKP